MLPTRTSLSFVPNVRIAKSFNHTGVLSTTTPPTATTGDAETASRRAAESAATASATPAETSPARARRPTGGTSASGRGSWRSLSSVTPQVRCRIDPGWVRYVGFCRRVQARDLPPGSAATEGNRWRAPHGRRAPESGRPGAVSSRASRPAAPRKRSAGPTPGLRSSADRSHRPVPRPRPSVRSGWHRGRPAPRATRPSTRRPRRPHRARRRARARSGATARRTTVGTFPLHRPPRSCSPRT